MAEELLQELINAWVANPDSREFSNLVDQHSAELSAGLASRAREVYTIGINTRQLWLAESAAMVAFRVYLRLREPRASLESLLDFNEVRFKRATTPASYAAVRTDCLAIPPAAQKIAASDLYFGACVLAADSAYFASSGSPEAEAGRWLLLALGDLVQAGQNWDPSSRPVEERFVNVASALFAVVHSRVDATVDSATWTPVLQQLAQSVEQHVPIDFRFEQTAGNSAEVARALSALSYLYGNRECSSARLEFAIRQAGQAGDATTRIRAMFDRYAQARDGGSPLPLRRELRSSLRDQLEERRLQYRSRAGRYFAAQLNELTLAELLRDELFEGEVGPPEVFQGVETLKARTLLDFLSAKSVGLNDEARLRAVDLERKIFHFEPEDLQSQGLWSDLGLVSQLPIGSNMPGIAGNDPRSAALASLEQLVSAENAGFQGCSTVTPLAEVQGALGPDELLIEYWLLPFAVTPPPRTAVPLWIFAIRPDRVQGFQKPIDVHAQSKVRMAIDGRQPLDVNPLTEAVAGLRKVILAGNDELAKVGLRQFYDILIGPLASGGIVPSEFRRWIIVPHGLFHPIPFGALVGPQGRYLIEDVAVTMVPSASVWVNLVGPQRPPPSSFLGMWNPTISYDNRFDALPEAEDEVDGVSSSLGGLRPTVKRGPEATKRFFFDHAPEKSIIHLSTHGEFPEQEAVDYHRVLLAGTSTEDGRLYAEEIRAMDLRSSRLFALGVCEGGLYRVGPGDEPYGLTPALLDAGVENVLGTLWVIESDPAGHFVKEFYKHLLESGPAESVRQSCQFMIGRNALIRQWAGWVLVGPGRPFNRPKAQSGQRSPKKSKSNRGRRS